MSQPNTFRPHRYRSSCGRIDLFARVYDEGQGDERPALLLMHGLTRNSADFEPLVPYLVDQYRLIVPDQRGRGQSCYDDDAANYRPDVYAADMFALIDGLQIGQAGLIGTSMGGLMAMIMAAMQPDRVMAIVLNDVGPKIEQEGLSRIQGYVGPTTDASDWSEAAARCAAINGSAFPDYQQADWLAFAQRTYSEVGKEQIRLAYDPAIAASVAGDEPITVPPDLWPLWDMLTAKPVLTLRGALSDLLSAETVREMAGRHSGPFVAVDIPNRGHAAMLDEPVAVQAISTFLQEHMV